MTDEHGYTLVELLVGMFVSMIVLGAIFMIVQVATRHQDRVAEHVAANQRARPAMTRIVDRLHSACVAPGLAPVLEGSTDNSMILLSKAGAAVSPTPDKYVVTFSNGVLSEAVYAGGGSPPKWSFPGFPGTPTASLQLVDGVTQAAVGNPPVTVPVFRYYAYQGGEVASTPLQTPLNAERAARTVQVDIAFTTSPNSDPAASSGAIALTDSATLRIEPASEDSAEVNLPCV